MFTKKCPYCNSANVKKNGCRNKIQLYLCRDCGKQFRGGFKLSVQTIWNEYLEGKQTITEIAERYHVSTSTVQRMLRKHVLEWKQPDLWGYTGYVHLDATYWGHNWGVMLGIDDATGKVLYMAFVKHETTMSYKIAVEEIIIAGYHIRGIIIDGKQELFDAFQAFPIQMCQFHMLQIVRRYLTRNPKMNASRDLLDLFECMTYLDADLFWHEYKAWKNKYDAFLNKRTVHKDGKTYYLHRRIRTLVKSIEFYKPYLFTYQLPECEGMPNTNNKIEGTFTDLKKNLNNHSGLTTEHRRQFIIAYFLAREKA